jgi:hypothetical protein
MAIGIPYEPDPPWAQVPCAPVPCLPLVSVEIRSRNQIFKIFIDLIEISD